MSQAEKNVKSVPVRYDAHSNMDRNQKKSRMNGTMIYYFWK